MASGDQCVILPGAHTVQHYYCDQYANGTITDVRTGEVVSTR